MPANARDTSSVPGSGRSPGEENGNPFQYSCLRNPIDGGAWRATVHGVTKSQMRLRDFTFTFTFITFHGYPGISVVKNLPAKQEMWIQSPGWEDPLEKRTATHSSILAWEIPWTEEPGGLQSLRSQRVGYWTHIHTSHSTGEEDWNDLTEDIRPVSNRSRTHVLDSRLQIIEGNFFST